jgi:hypothetical protein
MLSESRFSSRAPGAAPELGIETTDALMPPPGVESGVIGFGAVAESCAAAAAAAAAAKDSAAPADVITTIASSAPSVAREIPGQPVNGSK